MVPSDIESNFKVITDCRTCKSNHLKTVLDLGQQPLANALLEHSSDIEPFIPLELLRCDNCTTIQLGVNVKPELMFRDYLWVTGTSATAQEHCLRLANEIINRVGLDSRILEIGSNDGTLLRNLSKLGAVSLFGVDPAANISDSVSIPNTRIFADFFNNEFVNFFNEELETIDVVVARNVLSHVPDLNIVFKGISSILKDTGKCIVEFHEASKIISELHYDSIYHEHTYYHSLKSIQSAMSVAGLFIYDVTQSPISGGSLVVYASKEPQKPSAAYETLSKSELASGIYRQEAWDEFGTKARIHINELRELFSSMNPNTFAGFGASARSSTLLNAIGDPSSRMKAIADNNPMKWSRYSPGSHILINNPRMVISEEISDIFIFSFNFEDEIINYLVKKLDWHGNVHIPFPNKTRTLRI